MTYRQTLRTLKSHHNPASIKCLARFRILADSA